MRTILIILSAIVVSSAAIAVRGEDKQEDKSSIWMKQKLAASQNIFAGLTKGDFDMIGKNANSMRAVGYLERWVRADIPGYRTLMNDFEYANKSLALAAQEKNLDKAMVAYMQLTISCVECHKMIRD